MVNGVNDAEFPKRLRSSVSRMAIAELSFDPMVVNPPVTLRQFQVIQRLKFLLLIAINARRSIGTEQVFNSGGNN